MMLGGGVRGGAEGVRDARRVSCKSDGKSMGKRNCFLCVIGRETTLDHMTYKCNHMTPTFSLAVLYCFVPMSLQCCHGNP